MKQMTKEELIEYFIEQLGDNEILGPVMSVEKIREKLNYIVKDVTYHDEPGNFAGRWVIDKNGTGTVNFDIRKISLLEEKQNIIHELLHALSTSSKTKKVGKYYTDKLEKCGILFLKRSYRNDNYKIAYDEGNNIAINEGMTDTLAEMITGENHDGYNTEKDIYKIIAIIVGEDTMLREYFSESISDENSIFQRGLVEKYGDILGNDISTDLKKVSYLSDYLLNLDRNNVIHGLNEKGKVIQGKTRDEIYATLENMIIKVIEHEPDIMTKINDVLIPLFSTSLGNKFSERILGQLMNSQEFELDEKLVVLKYVKQAKHSHIPGTILESILADESLTLEERINPYLELCTYRERWDKIYEIYAKEGIISEEMYHKRKIFESIICYDDKNRNVNNISNFINNIKYRELGGYYEITRVGEEVESILYDKEGKHVNVYSTDYDQSSETGIDQSFLKRINRTFKNINIEELQEQLRKRYTKYSNFMSEQGLKKYEYGMEVLIRGSIIQLMHYCDNSEILSVDTMKDEFFLVNEDGSIEYIEPRCRTKIYR